MQPNTRIDSQAGPIDRRPKLNRLTSIIMIVLSLTALLTVLNGYAFPAQVKETDEGPAAHIFQLSIAALLPTILIFLFTADWRRPLRAARPLIFSSAILAIAFAALYHLEH